MAGRHVILGGEREGKKLPGFDLGNSPFEYEPHRVHGRTLLFASTNGSRAFLSTSSANRQWAVSFVNLRAGVEGVAAWLRAVLQDEGGGSKGPVVDLVCSGKLGQPAAEDSACAALFVERLREELQTSDLELQVSGSALPDAPRSESETLELLSTSSHGKYLASLGSEMERDVSYCSRWNVINYVPTGERSILREYSIPVP